MKNCKQIATEWGLSERTVNDLCKKNKIDGAIKVGKMWKIPDDAKKPIDGRITSGKYVRHSAGVTRKPLPIGISDYVRAQADYYYVDKTMLIKEFLDQKPLVSLFTRPRRFGKTLNMDMLRVFFEISEENTSKYFEDKAIWQCGEEYRNQQGQYPVVFLTFKDVKFDSWKATLDKIRDLLQEEFGRHQELATSERIAEYEKTYFAKIINGDASEVDLTASLAKLSQMLTKHYGKAPIIIIDEYDTPIQEGYSKDLQADGSYLCEVSIPNREIAAVYKSEVLSHLLQIGAITRTTANKIAESLYANDYKNLQKAIAEYMDKSVSFYDAGAEGFYHGLVLGLIALMDNQYKIKSNRESGDGRYDIGLFPREDRYPGILMELKWKKNLSADELSELADEALAQIGKKRYDVEMKENGTQDILKFGIVFSGKKVSVKIE